MNSETVMKYVTKCSFVLSSFGQNLETSTYARENLFAVLICMIGMLVVLVYLNAILQTYMQIEAKKSDLMEIEERRTMDIETWLCVNDLSGDLKTEIMGNVLEKLKPEEDVNNVKILSVIPWRFQLDIKKNLCLDMLQKVPMFRAGGERTMDLICGYLKPIIYNENNFILQEGDPVDKMLFITQGDAIIYRTSPDGSGSSSTSSISNGDHYGEQLLNLAPDVDPLSLPISNWSVKCSTKVEAFFLMAEDLRKIKIHLVESGYIIDGLVTNTM
uniref:cyclic nucleotide-gated ion channel 1-like n=1 Tax=Fragaria vesca subsp. vesca TaxID=101020 RepID=UPI0005C908E7|nr:PREDICTED: cyclic nucleotide-gated ion channel 1-like [Fragaria vesca subsp. vesca]